MGWRVRERRVTCADDSPVAQGTTADVGRKFVWDGWLMLESLDGPRHDPEVRGFRDWHAEFRLGCSIRGRGRGSERRFPVLSDDMRAAMRVRTLATISIAGLLQDLRSSCATEKRRRTLEADRLTQFSNSVRENVDAENPELLDGAHRPARRVAIASDTARRRELSL